MQEVIRKFKDVVFSNCALLLIPDNNQDYEHLKKYGFYQIDYFNSMKVAYDSLSQDSEKIKQYDFVLVKKRNILEIESVKPLLDHQDILKRNLNR